MLRDYLLRSDHGNRIVAVLTALVIAAELHKKSAHTVVLISQVIPFGTVVHLHTALVTL